MVFVFVLFCAADSCLCRLVLRIQEEGVACEALRRLLPRGLTCLASILRCALTLCINAGAGGSWDNNFQVTPAPLHADINMDSFLHPTGNFTLWSSDPGAVEILPTMLGTEATPIPSTLTLVSDTSDLTPPFDPNRAFALKENTALDSGADFLPFEYPAPGGLYNPPAYASTHFTRAAEPSKQLHASSKPNCRARSTNDRRQSAKRAAKKRLRNPEIRRLLALPPGATLTEVVNKLEDQQIEIASLLYEHCALQRQLKRASEELLVLKWKQSLDAEEPLSQVDPQASAKWQVDQLYPETIYQVPDPDAATYWDSEHDHVAPHQLSQDVSEELLQFEHPLPQADSQASPEVDDASTQAEPVSFSQSPDYEAFAQVDSQTAICRDSEHVGEERVMKQEISSMIDWPDIRLILRAKHCL
ncbi:hypothetical protein FA95DRAFT_1592677 [Auriscalpium vulgare]|uniref:Uncharacterized protein n=1 Tax=Auriscalpium vulgare TaxID=40419 RepID=A0ACB8S7B8_9AGAM|nr:hypothetical protein FA95DRAFT_1592677 [Auriscalpium vulgare]